MYKNKSVIVLVPAYNEARKIGHVVERTARGLVDILLVVDDASTDETARVARSRGAEVISHVQRRGVGAALRTGIEFARMQGFDIVVFIAGNNKDDPSQIPDLLDPICDGWADIVVGSRYRAGGRAGGDMPRYRRWATRLHPWLMSRFVGKRLTESTNGFRAVRMDIFKDTRIRLDQPWLDAYGLEVYLLFKALTLGYRHAEIPCRKTYPPKELGYTKMKPLVGWWSILRPIFLLGFRLRS
jgi:dolichol-phosphate mannosyltransferase